MRYLYLMFRKKKVRWMWDTEAKFNRTVQTILVEFPFTLRTDIYFSSPLSHWLLQSVVNFISELQEQMCRFQKEINNKIQEKKAQEFPVSSPPEAPTDQSPCMGSSRDRTPGQRRRPEGERRGQSSPHMQQQCHCGGQSVGIACSVAMDMGLWWLEFSQ